MQTSVGYFQFGLSLNVMFLWAISVQWVFENLQIVRSNEYQCRLLAAIQTCGSKIFILNGFPTSQGGKGRARRGKEGNKKEGKIKGDREPLHLHLPHPTFPDHIPFHIPHTSLILSHSHHTNSHPIPIQPPRPNHHPPKVRHPVLHKTQLKI